jgi:hypothetical protein
MCGAGDARKRVTFVPNCFCASPAPQMRPILKQCSVFLIIVLMCGVGDAIKIVTFVPNCQLFRTKVQLFIQNSHPRARAPNNNNKNKIVAHPTNHENAHFGPMQQPTNNLVGLV